MTKGYKQTIIDECVQFQGETFSNASDTHRWLQEAFYRVAESAIKSEQARILKLIEPYIENGKKAIAEGGMSQFGSASGGMMAKSALDAFEELKVKIYGKHLQNQS